MLQISLSSIKLTVAPPLPLSEYCLKNIFIKQTEVQRQTYNLC